eukprot:56299-Prymnesium_polylepis.1
MAGYPFERELAATGVTRWVDLGSHSRSGWWSAHWSARPAGWLGHRLHRRDVDVRETGRRATGHTREYR